jgi:hypothetical protein
MKTRNRTLISVFAVALTVLVLWYTNQPAAPRTASWDDVRAEAQSGAYQLVNTDQLWSLYQKNPNNLFLVDTRQAWEYRTGHLKGALNFPMEPTWLSRWRNKAALAKFLGSDKSRILVFY